MLAVMQMYVELTVAESISRRERMVDYLREEENPKAFAKRATINAFGTLALVASMEELWRGLRYPSTRLFPTAVPREDLQRPSVPIVRALQNRPRKVIRDTRTKERIIPGKLAQADPDTDSRAGRLFSLAAHSPDGQLAFPGWIQDIRGPALPLVLYDLGAGPSSTSQAAPLSLRIFIEAILAVPQADRGTGQPIAYEVPLREFLAWFWPERRPSPSEYWPKLQEAREALHKCLIPFIDPDTSRGQMRQIVNLAGIPRGAGHLDDVIRVVVDLPRGSQNGPQLPDSLRQWGNQSARAYRALINLAYLWWNPGRTHAPVGRGRHRKWTRVHDPKRYPALSDKDLVNLCSPTSGNQNHRDVLKKAIRTLQVLDEAAELQFLRNKGNWQVLPPAPRSRTELE